MQNLILHLYEPNKNTPEVKVTLPIAAMSASILLMPRKVKEALAREGIDLQSLAGQLDREARSGTLIEIERSDGKLIIANEQLFSVKSPVKKGTDTSSND